VLLYSLLGLKRRDIGETHGGETRPFKVRAVRGWSRGKQIPYGDDNQKSKDSRAS